MFSETPAKAEPSANDATERQYKITTMRFSQAEFLLVKRMMEAAGYSSVSGFIKDRLFNYENTVRKKTLHGTQEEKRDLRTLIEKFDYKASLQGMLASFSQIRRNYALAVRSLVDLYQRTDYFGNPLPPKNEELSAYMKRLEERTKELSDAAKKISILLQEDSLWKA